MRRLGFGLRASGFGKLLLLGAIGCAGSSSARVGVAGRSPASVTPVDGGQEAAPSTPADAGDFTPILLGEVEVINRLEGPLARADQPIKVTLEPARGERCASRELARRAGRKCALDGSLSFDESGYPGSRDPVLPRHRRPSFLVDYDDSAVQSARRLAVRLCGTESPTVDQLTTFVARYITAKDMARGFDIASHVASHKEGDCTEHAVLLAALARAFGHPARVILGLAFLEMQGRLAAFGHAWVETHDAGGWKLADAALPPEAGVRYLPLQVIEDEGPAYERHLLEGPAAEMLVRRVVVELPSSRH
jgi:hypothetical protein